MLVYSGLVASVMGYISGDDALLRREGAKREAESRVDKRGHGHERDGSAEEPAPPHSKNHCTMISTLSAPVSFTMASSEAREPCDGRR